MAIDVQFIVTRPEETRARGSIASSHIPTLGHPTSAWDIYRTVAVQSTDPRLVNLCFTDVSTVAGFCKVVFGPVESYSDIDAAELALQALLFHEDIEIIVPTAKIEICNPNVDSASANFIGYIRPDKNLRPQGCFDMFVQAETYDWLCATDYLLVEGGVIRQQQLGGNSLIGKSITAPGELLPGLVYQGQNIGPSIALDLKVSGYFLDSHAPPGSSDNFYSRFYNSVAIPWKRHVSSVPGVGFDLRIPPLLSIVFDRAQSRDKLPETIMSLRSELLYVRAELCEFDEMVRASESQIELEGKSTKILESFAAIVPESRIEQGTRMLAKIWRVIQPIRRAYNIAVNPLTLDPDQLERLVRESNAAVMENASLVDRTITASTFARLLRTESMRRLIGKHLTESEIHILERSERASE